MYLLVVEISPVSLRSNKGNLQRIAKEVVFIWFYWYPSVYIKSKEIKDPWKVQSRERCTISQ
jgi:hypothetical protein